MTLCGLLPEIAQGSAASESFVSPRSSELGYSPMMRMLSGKVLNGSIVVDDELPEGAQVTIVLDDQDAAELAPEEAAELAEQLAAAQRGDVVEYRDIDDIIRDVCQ